VARFSASVFEGLPKGLHRMTRILIVANECSVAMELSWTVEDAGYSVVGPERSMAAAIETLLRYKADLALLAVGLQPETVLPAARTLAERALPFIFVTGPSIAPPIAPPLSWLPAEYRGRPVVNRPCEALALAALIKRTLDEASRSAAGTT
jgi:CheY-like chemotaxis protein